MLVPTIELITRGFAIFVSILLGIMLGGGVGYFAFFDMSDKKYESIRGIVVAILAIVGFGVGFFVAKHLIFSYVL